jgi:hypothetical protein
MPEYSSSALSGAWMKLDAEKCTPYLLDGAGGGCGDGARDRWGCGDGARDGWGCGGGGARASIGAGRGGARVEGSFQRRPSPPRRRRRVEGRGGGRRGRRRGGAEAARGEAEAEAVEGPVLVAVAGAVGGIFLGGWRRGRGAESSC